MTTLAALQHRTATLAQEARRRYPSPGPDIRTAIMALFTDDEHEQVEAFFAEIEPRLGTLPSGNLDLSGITDDELDTLATWANLAKEREDASKKAGKL